MVFRKISDDIKRAAIHLSERDLLSLQDILDCCGFSEWTWYRVTKLWREMDDVINQPRTVPGRPRHLDREDIDYLLQLICDNPDYFLDDLVDLTWTNRFISAHFITIFNELDRAGMSHKRLKRIAWERNEELRGAFVARMAQYDPSELGFIDEVSKDERTLGRHYGRSAKGKRAHKKQPFVHGRRVSMEALLTLNGIVACMYCCCWGVYDTGTLSWVARIYSCEFSSLRWVGKYDTYVLLVARVFCMPWAIECFCNG